MPPAHLYCCSSVPLLPSTEGSGASTSTLVRGMAAPIHRNRNSSFSHGKVDSWLLMPIRSTASCSV